MKKIIVAMVVGFGAASVFLIDLISIFFKASDPTLSSTSWTTTQIFLFIIFALFWLGLAQLYFKWSRIKSFAGSIPGHMTALGILGTFTGIFVGLYKFDVHNLHISVPLLLDGMKLAFVTSIAGLTGSTVLKVTHSITISIFGGPDPYVPDPDLFGGDINIADATFSMLMTMSDKDFNDKLERLRSLKKEFNDLDELFKNLHKEKDTDSF